MNIIKKEHKLLHKVMCQFEGMNKIDILDLLHKIEVLLFYAKSPITKEEITSIINADFHTNKDIDPWHFTILPNGNFCECIGYNDWIHIYKEIKSGVGKWNLVNSHYFKTKHAPLELLRLNKKNLLQQLENTLKEEDIKIFLQKNSALKKDPVTRKLLILDF
ncbi:hypothetical protein ACWGOQ_0006220 [Aquimarina sp. M1]